MTDPQIFWLNDRPYLLHRSVGKGGFGEVHRVEMMLPLGMEVRRKPKTGAFVLDADGSVCVQLTKERPVPIAADRSSLPSGAATMEHQRGVLVATDEGVAKALQVSEPAPDSMFLHTYRRVAADRDPI